MRVSSAISQLKKILKNAQEWANADTAYYETTIAQYRELQSLCDDVSKVLSGISHVRRCDVSESCEVNNNIADMQKQLEALAAEMRSGFQALNSRVDDIQSGHVITNGITVSTPSADIIDEDDDAAERKMAKVAIPDGVEEGTNLNITFSKQKDPKKAQVDARSASKEYNRVLKKLAGGKHKYPAIADLSELLYKWHTKRFYDNWKYNSQFHYSYKRVSKLIYLITIAYGYHMSNNTLDTFKDQFNEFLDRIGTDDRTTNQHAVPKEIYNLEKEYDESYDNVHAIILFEKLCEAGLSELETTKNVIDPYKLDICGVEYYMVDDRCAFRGAMNDEYSNYHKHPEYILGEESE